MNAEEARRLTLESAKEEIDSLKITIEAAAKKGETQVVATYPLMLGTLKWLKENGYTVSEFAEEGDTYIHW